MNLEEGEGAKVIRRYGINIPNVMLVLDKEGNVRHMISNVIIKLLVFLRLGTLVEIALRSLWSNI